MRAAPLLVPMLVAALACGGAGDDAMTADSGVASTAEGTRGLAEADFAGTWDGQAMMEGSDSVVARFSQTCRNGTCLGVVEGTTDTTTSSYRIEGDSVVGSSAPYASPDFNATVVDGYVIRVTGDSATGTGTVKLADRDSVLVRMRFTATRVSR